MSDDATNSMNQVRAGDRPSDAWLWGPYSSLGLAVLVLTVVADQFNKYWMLHIYEIEQKGRVAVTSWFDLVFVINKGVSYGIGASDSPLAQYGWIAFALIVSAGMWVWMARQTSVIAALGLGFIIGGALGNAIDRFHMGGVADFYIMRVLGFSTNVFNIADAAIVVGVVGLLYHTIFIGDGDAAKAT